jgi:methanogenic corrinoid protein MtbC1
MAGGLPFVLNPGLARRIGADGTAPDARGAVTWADGRFGRAS